MCADKSIINTCNNEKPIQQGCLSQVVERTSSAANGALYLPFSSTHLEFPSFGQILDTFERLVLLPVHVQTTDLETFAGRRDSGRVTTGYISADLRERLEKGWVWVLPEMASCWILNSMLSEGLSSGFGAPACVVRVPRRLGSFWGFSFPMSQTNT